MKLIKGLGLSSFLLIATGSCFDPPEFPVVPQIEYAGVEFIDSPDSDVDSLILYLNFKDGDGDLGFDSRNPRHLSDPYNYAFFYQENNGTVEPIATESGYIDNQEFELLLIPDPSRGKLVVHRTRKKPEYNFLPPAEPCGGYLRYY